ncbi:MAG: hypothetical protein NC420_00955 [Eubacterium sp.]|nr:hypothetical protein [Eubacterium sp.]MCM1213829.1 hypothetical protein [Lachnospiraceae bacterium]MCM1237949.1 hypothetical protein [Lachnospiraceae bacterium]
MIDFNLELEEMTSGKNLMNSYKLYFLKTLIVNASKDKRVFGFYEMASWMCVYSFSDVCCLGKRIRPLDKLFDAAVMVIEEDLMQSSKISEVFDAVSNTENKELRNTVMSLCNYVPYRLLAYMWQNELKGKTDRQKNQLIEEYSKSEQKCVYSIYSMSQKDKTIEVKLTWAEYIAGNRRRLLMWIDKKIEDFVGKE